MTSVTGTSWGVGGLVGYISISTGDLAITNCYATGNITGTSDVGGFVGHAETGTSSTLRISNCYATGDVKGTDNTGGFSGYLWRSVISNCWSMGQNLSTSGNRGGFTGARITGTSTPDNFFVTQTSGIGAVGNGVATGITRQNAPFFTPVLAQATLSAGAGAGQWDFSGAVPILKWQVPKPPSNPLTFQIGTDGTNLSAVTVDTGFTLGGFSVSFANPDSARAALISCDALLKQINVKRGEIGASSNIISSIIDGNTVTNENIVASRSRVQDADIARESANAVRNQILQNASAALLSQSKNMVGDVVLMLLRGI